MILGPPGVVRLLKDLDTDIAGALNAGIPGIWLRHSSQPPDPGVAPTRTIVSLGDLPGCVDALYTQS